MDTTWFGLRNISSAEGFQNSNQIILVKYRCLDFTDMCFNHILFNVNNQAFITLS